MLRLCVLAHCCQASADVESTASAVLSSWPLDPRVIAILILSALIYWRGWLRGRRLLRDQKDGLRLGAFPLQPAGVIPCH